MGVYGPGQGQQLHVHMLVASLWASLTAGFVYSFGVFSSVLQGKFNLTQSQISAIATSHLAVHFFTFTCGLLVDALGVRTTLVFGSSLNATCWFILGTIAIFELTQSMFVFTLLTAGVTYGAACTVAAVFSALAKNFGRERGAAIGIAKAWSGMASGVLLTILVSIIPSNNRDSRGMIFVWALAGSIVVLALLPSPLIRVLSTSTVPLKAHIVREDQQRYRLQLWLLTGATLLFIGVTVGAVLMGSVSGKVHASFTALMVTCIFMPGWLLLPGQSRLGLSAIVEDAALARGTDASNSDGSEESDPIGMRVVAATLGPLDLIQRLDAWLLWIAVFALHGGAFILTTSNFGVPGHNSMGHHLEGLPIHAVQKTSRLPIQALIFSTAQSVGRLFGGFISDAVVARHVARPWCLAVLLLCMACAQMLVYMPGVGPLHVGVCLAGLVLGSMYPVLICTVVELFGVARVASNYMIFDGTPLAMAYILGSRVWSHSEVFFLNGREGIHHYMHHYNNSKLVACTTIFQLVATVAAAALAVRARPLYRRGVPPQMEDAGEAVPHTA